MAALSLACVGYMFVNYDYVVNRFPTAHPLSPMDMVVGVTAIVLVLEATRRTIGAALPIVAIVFLVYGFAGPWLFGWLYHRGLSLEVTVDQTYFTTEGIFGVPMSVAGTYVILFIIFGTFLEKSGAGQFFMNFANAIAGGARGGPGKVAVVSSSLFGTISGSAVANVMVDGWLTIPMMKKTGFKPEAAAAIEAVASTGGQIMPPIMGAAAFVMAEFMGVSYTQVMIAAAIPALFYYGALFAAIHFNAVRSGLKGLPREELPILGHIIVRQGHLFLPVIVLLALLLYGFTPTYGAIIATVALVAISWLRPCDRTALANCARSPARRRGEHRAGGDGLCVCGDRDRDRAADRACAAVHRLSRRFHLRLAAAGAAHHHGGRDRARHGNADHARLHHASGAAGAGDHEARGGAHGGAHVRLLLLVPVGGDAARGTGRVCRRVDRRSGPVGVRCAGGEVRSSRLHRAVLLRLQSRAALRGAVA